MNNLTNLTEEQKQTLVDIVVDTSGHVLTRQAFADLVFELFEFIPGFESIPYAQEHCIINQLWRKYHDQEFQKNRNGFRTTVRQ